VDREALRPRRFQHGLHRFAGVSCFGDCRMMPLGCCRSAALVFCGALYASSVTPISTAARQRSPAP
jgi:hypothetical protein